MWLLPYSLEEGNGLGCLSQGSIVRAGCLGGMLYPESGSANSLSAVSFLPGFLQSLNTSGEETSWKTVTEGRCRPLSRAEQQPLRDIAQAHQAS